jgi:hypothetical protein
MHRCWLIMLNVTFDTKDFSNKMQNLAMYSKGFFNGIESNRQKFNLQLGEYSLEILNRFIDSKARMSPDSLHHVYEWNQVGSPGARLFNIETSATQTSIIFYGNFLPSRSVSDGSSEPFIRKAEIMENSIMIEISPRSSNVLAFEADGETVFTTDSIYIDNPGGDEVSGSFGKVIEEFFENYYTNTVLMQSGIFQKLSSPIEYSQGFNQGLRGGGFSAGKKAGKKYLTVRGGEFS